MYKQPWVQAMVKQVQDFLVANADWLGINPDREGHRVLDYACGHGTISLVRLATYRPHTVLYRRVMLDARLMEVLR